MNVRIEVREFMYNPEIFIDYHEISNDFFCIKVLLTNPVMQWAIHLLLIEDNIEDQEDHENRVIAASNKQWAKKEIMSIKLTI